MPATLKETATKKMMNRRQMLIGSALGLGAVTAPGLFRPALAATDWNMASSIRSLSNPYHAMWDRGGRDFADSVGANYSALVSEGNSEKGISDLAAFVARHSGRVILGVDPNDSPDARPMVESVVKAGGYIVTVWNKPDDLHPWDFGDNYVAHFTFNGVKPGQDTAATLFDAMGNSGGIVALGGIPSNLPAIQRKQGLMNQIKANGNVELLDFQDADWDPSKANNIMSAWITRFGSDIKGVWCANDGMAIGALEALRQEGLAGEIPICGMDATTDGIRAIRAKELVATADWNPYWIGGYCLSLGLAAANGEFSPSQEPELHREFNVNGTIVTQADVEQFYKENVENTPKVDWNDRFGMVDSQITY